MDNTQKTHAIGLEQAENEVTKFREEVNKLKSMLLEANKMSEATWTVHFALEERVEALEEEHKTK